MKSHKDKFLNEKIRLFWEENPLCLENNPFEPNSKEYFSYYDLQREEIETEEFSECLHEYKSSKGKNVLDIGCGNAYVLSRYALNGALVTGVDITKKAIEISKNRFRHLGISGQFITADAQDLPFNNNTFDIVCSMGVLHHIPDIEKALEEIYRVLKPNAKVILMFYHRNSARYQLYFRAQSIIKGKSLEKAVNENDGIGNPKAVAFTKKEMRSMLQNFNNVSINIDFLPPRDIILRGSQYFPKNIFKPLAKFFGWNMYIKAEKPND